MRIALCRDPSPNIERCELTHMQRQPIDFKKVMAQHRAYEETLNGLGIKVQKLAPLPDCADGVFVEDTAFVLDEVAILCRPGVVSRQPEVDSTAMALSDFRDIKKVTAPGTIDGGDVLVIGKHVYIGEGQRSNTEAIQQVREFLTPYGYHVRGVPLKGCLHLKTAVTAISDELLIVNPEWIDMGYLRGFNFIEVDRNEPFAANILRVGEEVICAAAHEETAAKIRREGIPVNLVDVSELAKAEAGLTCCSIIFKA